MTRKGYTKPVYLFPEDDIKIEQIEKHMKKEYRKLERDLLLNTRINDSMIIRYAIDYTFRSIRNK